MLQDDAQVQEQSGTQAYPGGFGAFSQPAGWPPPPPVPGARGNTAAAAATPVRAAYELRPLSTGELLDRTFSLYRRRFWLFVGLAAIASTINTAGTFVRLTWGFTGFGPQTGNSSLVMQGLVVSLVASLVTALFFIVAWSMTQAATVAAVSIIYLGPESPAEGVVPAEGLSIGSALSRVKLDWFRYVLIALWQGWSAAWIPSSLLVLGLVFLVPALGLKALGLFFFVLAALSLLWSPFAYARNALAVPASVLERLPVRRAMRRSKDLVGSRMLRLVALLILLYVLSAAAGVVQAIFAAFMQYAHSYARVALEVLTLIATFITGSLVTPVAAIAFALYYVDERVRREGLDVDVLMDRNLGPAPSAANRGPAPPYPGAGASSTSAHAPGVTAPFGTGPESIAGPGYAVSPGLGAAPPPPPPMPPGAGAPSPAQASTGPSFQPSDLV